MKIGWAPAIIMGLGAVLTLGVAKQRSVPLVRPLAEVIPMEILGYQGRGVLVSDDEAQVAGFSNYLLRVYEMEREETRPWLSVYVGFYESQAQGKTIHSPKNCLPGAGWEALSSDSQELELDDRSVRVNRYLLQNEGERALVLYPVRAHVRRRVATVAPHAKICISLRVGQYIDRPVWP